MFQVCMYTYIRIHSKCTYTCTYVIVNCDHRLIALCHAYTSIGSFYLSSCMYKMLISHNYSVVLALEAVAMCIGIVPVE